jgi:predicted ATPase
MLTSFSVAGFKSVRDEANLAFAPLTVIVGANSSGKSSLLQSFLLLSQSIQVPSSDSVLDFNGLFENLGTLQEVQSRPTSGALVINAGFTVPDARRRAFQAFELGFVPRSATYSISVSPVDDATGRNARIDEFELRVRDGSDSEAILLAHRRRGGFPPTPHLANASGRPTLLATQNYRVVAGPITSTSPGSTPDSNPAVGIELAGPLPLAIWRAYDAVVRSLDATLRDVLFFGAHRVGATGVPDSPDIERLALAFWDEPEVRDLLGNRPASVLDARRRILTLRPTVRTRARSLVGEYVQQVARHIEPTWAFERQPLPGAFASAVDELRERLSSVHYLGPLRAAPRPLFAAKAGSSPKSVGREGEFTAAVLSRYERDPVSFWFEGQRVQEPLGDAVGRWMRYMDLHTGAVAHDYGRLGHDLLVQDSVAGSLDLTQVGVGVSQALPVIVQCLVAPAGSVVVLEQPELHLHPRVQSRLADFLMAVAKIKRTVICETHSEYLVSRLRIATGRRVLTYGTDYRLYFTSRVDGVTELEEVPVQGKGRLLKWPKGFFDQSAEDANALIEIQVSR